MNKHTESPWALVPHGEMSNGVKMYWVNQQTSIATTNEDDARLIAAAPELLEALETLLTHIDWGEPLSKSSVIYRRAQNATTKAKGEV